MRCGAEWIISNPPVDKIGKLPLKLVVRRNIPKIILFSVLFFLVLSILASYLLVFTFPWNVEFNPIATLVADEPVVIEGRYDLNIYRCRGLYIREGARVEYSMETDVKDGESHITILYMGEKKRELRSTFCGTPREFIEGTKAEKILDVKGSSSEILRGSLELSQGYYVVIFTVIKEAGDGVAKIRIEFRRAS